MSAPVIHSTMEEIDLLTTDQDETPADSPMITIIEETGNWLLEMSPGQWCDTLSRDQAMTAAMQLHKDVCLINTNLDILDQYAFALNGTASKILPKTIGGSPYPKAEVAAEAQGPRARRASVHMEALGLWRPSLDPMQ